MSLVVVVGSVKGAPGVTAAALALAAAWPERADGAPSVLVETDRSGGSLLAWCGAGTDGSGLGGSGLVGLAAAVQHATGGGPGVAFGAYGDALVCGVAAVRAPAVGPQAAAAVEVLERTRFAVLRQAAGSARVVVVDAGRLDPVGSSVLGAADVLVLVARGGVDAMGHVAGRIEELQARVPIVDLVVVGPSPYEPVEVQAAFGIGRVHGWPWDPTGVRGLVEGRRGWPRAALPKAARALAEDLCWRADTGQLARPGGGLVPVEPPRGAVADGAVVTGGGFEDGGGGR
ncbi:hypothetical protein OG216_08755 [Streptomycetaceae bacterium NBC_01309]